MRSSLCSILLLAFPSALTAQDSPKTADPLVRTIERYGGEELSLQVPPQTGLTVTFEPSELIRNVSIEDGLPIQIRVSPERDSLLILPVHETTNGLVGVATERQQYRIRVLAGSGQSTPYLVRFGSVPMNAPTEHASSVDKRPGQIVPYKVRGDRAVQPLAISDDGTRTFIEFATDQALPAIFAVGQTGNEEVVNGYVREELFVIDRVFAKLVFRIDNARAVAERLPGRVAGQ